MSNEHIQNFLEYYYEFIHTTDYAVLIKGKWGSGKTWFIKKSFEKAKENDREHLYVSLNGVSTFDEIETMFFEQLHPVLASKGIKLLGNLVKNSLKLGLKLDFDGDSKSDGDVSIDGKNIILSDWLTQTKNYILVFDDLERCSIKINDILGYINNFVEHSGYKTIIIANEEEIIIEKDKKLEKNYKRIKEKLIGQTFEITTDIDSALIEFLNQITTEPKCRELCKDNSETIKELYILSGHHNLRHVKHALWGFERLYQSLPEKVIEKKELLLKLLQFYLIFSFELKSGDLDVKDLGVLFRRSYFSLAEDQKDEKEKNISNIIEKYSSNDFFKTYLDDRQWEQILDKGILEHHDIGETLLNSSYFYDEMEEPWKKALYSIDMDDDAFETNMKKIKQQWASYEIHDLGIIKHLTGLYLWLSKIKVLDKDETDIVKESLLYVDYLISHDLSIVQKGIRKNHSYDGIVFFEEENPLFKDFCRQISEKFYQAKTSNYKINAGEILESMTNDTQEFISKLIYKGHSDGEFIDIPLLSFIKPKDFVSKFLKLKTPQKHDVISMLDERYIHQSISSKFLVEIDWLNNVKTLLNKENKKLEKQGKISFHNNKLFIISIENAIKKLNTRKKQ